MKTREEAIIESERLFDLRDKEHGYNPNAIRRHNHYQKRFRDIFMEGFDFAKNVKESPEVKKEEKPVNIMAVLSEMNPQPLGYFNTNKVQLIPCRLLSNKMKGEGFCCCSSTCADRYGRIPESLESKEDLESDVSAVTDKEPKADEPVKDVWTMEFDLEDNAWIYVSGEDWLQSMPFISEGEAEAILKKLNS